MQKSELESLNWQDISILRNTDNSLLIILLFKTQLDADKAAIDGIGKHPFKFNVSRTVKGTYNFDLEFLDSEYAIRYASKMTRESYPPVTWLEEGVPTYITTGIITSDGKITRLAVMMQIDNLFVS